MSYVHFDEAVRQVGKAEVTLRRLVKAGKISHKKEKTLTGFVYLVDPEEIIRYYGEQGAEADIEPSEDEAETPKQATPKQQVRLAVSGESGSLNEYWQKRAETFETRYHQAVIAQGELREELGLWKGRAEQAQNMVVKLLPAPQAAPAPVVEKPNPAGNWVVALLGVVSLALLAGFGLMIYQVMR